MRCALRWSDRWRQQHHAGTELQARKLVSHSNGTLQPLHILQSDSFVKHASESTLHASQHFLQRELPERIAGHLHLLARTLAPPSAGRPLIPSTQRSDPVWNGWPAASESIKTAVQQQQDAAHISTGASSNPSAALRQLGREHMLRIITAVDGWQQQSQQNQLPEATTVSTSQQATLVQQQQASFALSLHELKNACEASLHTLTSACQALVRQPSWHHYPGNDQEQQEQPQQQDHHHHHQLLNSLLDQCNHHMLSLRFMTAQHMAAWYSIAPEQLRPTHSGPPNSNPFPNLVWQSCPVLQLLQLTVEDCR